MKYSILKKYILLCSFVFVFPLVLNAQTKRTFGADFGISSGYPAYGSSSVIDMNNSVNPDDNPNRFIIGLNGDVYFSVIRPLKLLVGADALADFIWNGQVYNNHLDYSFWTGVKVYVGAGGLNFGLAYLLGCRTDFSKIDSSEVNVSSASWGNGFRLSLEYDFLYCSSWDALPAIGAYYRCVPRGNNEWDNIIACYLNISF